MLSIVGQFDSSETHPLTPSCAVVPWMKFVCLKLSWRFFSHWMSLVLKRVLCYVILFLINSKQQMLSWFPLFKTTCCSNVQLFKCLFELLFKFSFSHPPFFLVPQSTKAEERRLYCQIQVLYRGWASQWVPKISKNHVEFSYKVTNLSA